MFETIDRQNASLKVFGYCDKDNEALLRLAQEGEYERLRSLKGEYTLIYEEDHRCTIVSSPVGAMHYFYTLPGTSPPGFHHGRSIAGILSKARLEWRWNWQALGDLCQLENLTGTASLHPDIKRVPPGTILQFSNGRLRINSKSLIESLEDQPADPHKAVEALNREVARIAGEQPFLSLSGGFDSRVILSSMLRQGIKPHLITMGNDSCSDVQVARAIAHRFGLEHKLVRITLDDFLSHAPAISRLTNGTKTAWHWHTYLYPLKASIPEKSSFFVGTLGEFARTYYFDRGQIGRAHV